MVPSSGAKATTSCQVMEYSTDLTPKSRKVQIGSDDPLDICRCGDYRRDHARGAGACIFNPKHAIGDGHFGAGRCDKFQLSRRKGD